MKLLLALALLLLAPVRAADNQSVVDWIRANAIRLNTPEAGHGFDDMQPLKKVIGDARVVELGEATHGTREFFQLKHRMLEFLATQMGFTIFSIEANMPEAYKLNDYVLTGKGDPKELLKGMYFWTWDTEEVLDMILWMRKFNESGKGRIEFTGFDMQTPNVALGIVRGFVGKYDEDYLATLRTASNDALKARPTQPSAPFGVATATFPIQDAAGKRVRYSGWIRTEGITRGYAGLWWRVDGKSGTLAFDNMMDRGVTGTTDWARYTIELPVAADARNINFGAILTGDGTAWFDQFTVELDGKPYSPPTGQDFDFESGAAGFYTGGAGYRVAPDSAVFHNGAQSLRMNFVSAQPAPPAVTVDVKATSAAWSEVVRHMESMRETYAKKGAPAHDIEWSIQNARVVLQCMQMFANQVSRDSSMAQNIKWILDHSPKDKLVVWAHNGHVKAGGEGYASMGAELRDLYKDKMVVFGFAFNQGSFQAVELQKSLHDWTVPPAPESSLDATLAATGIPLFALDLRHIPADGPVADWWSRPHPGRSIGAVYSDKNAANYFYPMEAPKSYDALLFVEKTTAARPVGPITLGSREYRDADAHIRLPLPEGWGMRPSFAFGDHETNVPLAASQSTAAAPALYYKVLDKPRVLTADSPAAQLRADCDAKVKQRVDSGLADYHVRPDSYQERTIDGHVALACTSEYTRDGRTMVEYAIRVHTDKVVIMFFAQLPAADLEQFRPRFDKLADALRIE